MTIWMTRWKNDRWWILLINKWKFIGKTFFDLVFFCWWDIYSVVCIRDGRDARKKKDWTRTKNSFNFLLFLYKAIVQIMNVCGQHISSMSCDMTTSFEIWYGRNRVGFQLFSTRCRWDRIGVFVPHFSRISTVSTQHSGPSTGERSIRSPLVSTFTKDSLEDVTKTRESMSVCWLLCCKLSSTTSHLLYQAIGKYRGNSKPLQRLLIYWNSFCILPKENAHVMSLRKKIYLANCNILVMMTLFS